MTPCCTTPCKRGPVAVGLAGDPPGGQKKADDGGRPPVLLHVLDSQTDPARIVPSFSTSLRSIPALDGAAAGHGVLSVAPDDDGTFRRLPLVSRVSGNYVPALSLEVLRLANSAVIELYFAKGGMLGAKAGDLVIPTQRDGTIWVNFTPHDPSRYVSAVDVLTGHLPKGVSFDRLLVLMGVTGLGQTDQRMTPQGQMPGVEIQAQLLENIYDGHLAHRPGWAGGRAGADHRLRHAADHRGAAAARVLAVRRHRGGGRGAGGHRDCLLALWRFHPGGCRHAADRAVLRHRGAPGRRLCRGPMSSAAACARNWKRAGWPRPGPKANWKRRGASRQASCPAPPVSRAIRVSTWTR